MLSLLVRMNSGSPAPPESWLGGVYFVVSFIIEGDCFVASLSLLNVRAWSYSIIVEEIGTGSIFSLTICNYTIGTSFVEEWFAHNGSCYILGIESLCLCHRVLEINLLKQTNPSKLYWHQHFYSQRASHNLSSLHLFIYEQLWERMTVHKLWSKLAGICQQAPSWRRML